jgi:alkylation response protein AidB-like acyl-CoA dehydrogenase
VTSDEWTSTSTHRSPLIIIAVLRRPANRVRTGSMRYDFTPRSRLARRVRPSRDNITPALLDGQREADSGGRGPLAQRFILKMRDHGLFNSPGQSTAWGARRSTSGSSSTSWRRRCADAALGITSVAPTLMRVGSEAQKQYWLPKIKAAAVDFALGYSEPEAGTDLASLRMRAVLDGDTWVVNGQKMWNTMAHTATHNWVAVRTEPDAPKHKGISMMIVPMDAPGVEVQPIYVWPGLRTNEVFFDNVRVPRDYLIGERGMGFYYAAMALNFERLSIGSVGMVRRYFRELVQAVRELHVDGQPLRIQPWVRERLARLAVDIEAAGMLGLETAWALEQGRVPAPTHRWPRCSSASWRSASPCRQRDPRPRRAAHRGAVGGAAAHQWLYRTAPLLAFGGGTEVQRTIIAMLGYGLRASERPPMDLARTPDQQALADAVERFCQDQLTPGA